MWFYFASRRDREGNLSDRPSRKKPCRYTVMLQNQAQYQEVARSFSCKWLIKAGWMVIQADST